MQFSVTLIIVVITCIVSYKAFQDKNLKYKLMFSAYNCKHHNEYYRFLSHVLIHADFMHLFFNMFVLYSFGKMMETQLMFEYGTKGVLHFLILYIGGGLFSTVWPYAKNGDNPNYLSLGASGAVSAVVFAFIIWNPTAKMGLILLPIMIPAWIFGIIYLAYEYIMAKRGKSNIGHDAHLGGAIFGILYILLINLDKGKEFLNTIFG